MQCREDWISPQSSAETPRLSRAMKKRWILLHPFQFDNPRATRRRMRGCVRSPSTIRNAMAAYPSYNKPDGTKKAQLKRSSKYLLGFMLSHCLVCACEVQSYLVVLEGYKVYRMKRCEGNKLYEERVRRFSTDTMGNSDPSCARVDPILCSGVSCLTSS